MQQDREESRGHRVLRDLAFFGHFLHTHAGGRSGKRHVLARLSKAGGQLSQRDLQEHSQISSAALSEVLTKLECEGLIERTRSDEDRRQMDIALTEEGSERAARLKEEFEAFEAECLSCLDDDEQVQLLELLDRLADYWRGMDGKEIRA